MAADSTILGVGVTTGSIIVLRGLVTGTNFAGRFVSTIIVTLLLTGLSAIGLGQIAVPLAWLAAFTIISADLIALFKEFSK